ncbi:MAG: anti-sigma factor [bacterium]|nr:anti-sigma factor [bacterium]
MPKKCSDYIQDLNDYLDGEISPELCEEIDKHVGECKNCRLMVDSMKMTVKLCREGKSEELPVQLQDKLTSLLKKRWDEKFKSSQK